VFALYQYLHLFYFLALFDYEIACLLVQLISLFAFYKLHNSYVNRSFLGGTHVRHFFSFSATTSMYSITHYTLYSYSVCSAKLSAVPTKTIKPIRPFFFLREKRNKKTCPLPPQQRGVLLSCSFKNQQGTGSIF